MFLGHIRRERIRCREVVKQGTGSVSPAVEPPLIVDHSNGRAPGNGRMVPLPRSAGHNVLDEGNAVDLRERIDAGSPENHGCKIMVLDEVVAPLTTMFAARHADQQGNVVYGRSGRVSPLAHKFRHEDPVAFSHHDPVANAVTVVGCQYHQGVFQAAHHPQRFHEVTEPAVAQGDIAEVIGPRTLQQLGIHIRYIPVEGDHVLPALLRHVHLAVVLRDQPWLVGVEFLNREEELLRIPIFLQPPGRFYECSCRKVILFPSAAAHVDEALSKSSRLPLAPPGAPDFGRHPVVKFGLGQPGSRFCRIAPLSPQIRPLLKAPGVVHIRQMHGQCVRDKARAVADIGQHLGKRVLIPGNRPPAGIPVFVEVRIVKGIDPSPRVHRSSRFKGRQRLGICPVHDERFLSEPFKIRGMDFPPGRRIIHAARAVLAPGVEYNQNDVHCTVSFQSVEFRGGASGIWLQRYRAFRWICQGSGLSCSGSIPEMRNGAS